MDEKAPKASRGPRLLRAAAAGATGTVLAFAGMVVTVSSMAASGGGLHHAPWWLVPIILFVLFGLPLINGGIWGLLVYGKERLWPPPWPGMLISLAAVLVLPWAVFIVAGLFFLFLQAGSALKGWWRLLLVAALAAVPVVLIVVALRLSRRRGRAATGAPSEPPAEAGIPRPPPGSLQPFARGVIVMAATAVAVCLPFGLFAGYIVENWGRATSGGGWIDLSGLGEMLLLGILQLGATLFCFLGCLILVAALAVRRAPLSGKIINPFLFALLCVGLNLVLDLAVLLFLGLGAKMGA
jgi:hypothetical protein